MNTAVRGAAALATALGLGLAPQLAAAAITSADPPAPALDSVVVWALAVAPELAAARARTEAATSLVAAARGLEDPTLEVSFQDVGFPANTLGEEEMSMLGAELRQSLPFFGKRGARQEAAVAAAALATADLDTRSRQVEREVRTLYAGLYAADRRAETLASAVALLGVLADAAAARYAAGTTSMEAPLRAQVARSRLQLAVLEVTAERRGLEADLARLLDLPADHRWGRVATLPEATPPPADWPERTVTNAPEVLARGAAVTAALRRIAAEDREGRPDLFAGAGYAARGGFDPVVTFRLGTALPIWRGGRQGPRVDAARAEAAMAREELRAARAAARAQAAQFVAAWERSDGQVQLIRDALLPQSRTALDAARAAYETGQVGFSTVIEDFEVWLDAAEELARREAERCAAWAGLQALVAPPSPANAGGSR